MFALANRKDTNGLPLFSALGSALAPFVGPQTLPQDYTFAGQPGQVAGNEVAIPYALDGDRAFMHLPARDGVFNATLTTVTAPAHAIGTTGVDTVIGLDGGATTGGVTVGIFGSNEPVGMIGFGLGIGGTATIGGVTDIWGLVGGLSSNRSPFSSITRPFFSTRSLPDSSRITISSSAPSIVADE